MNVSDQLQQVRILLAQNRLIAVLKKVALAVVTPVKLLGIAGQQPAHDGDYWGRAGPQQQMDVV